MLCHWLLLGFAFKTVDPGLISPDRFWPDVLTSCIVLVKNINGSCFPYLFVCISQNSWHPVTTDLQIVSSSKTAIKLPLLMGRVENNLCFYVTDTAYYFINLVMSGIIVAERWPLCGMSQSSAPPVSASFICLPHHHMTLMSTVASLTILDKHLWIEVGLSPFATSNSVTAHCFEWSVSAIWGSSVVLPSVEWNSCEY